VNQKLLAIFAALIMGLGCHSESFAQKPMRAGTTSANFLEIGFGAAGASMGDSYVSLANDASAIYWNPAGLANLERSEAMFVSQPWIAEINTSMTALALVLPNFGTIGLGFINANYGEMEVTTLAMQEGTGEMFASQDMVVSLSYARKIVNWFSVGASSKYVASKIWHTSAWALAFDLGVIIQTDFFSTTGRREDGLNIGMSIANYGSPLRYEGMDLLQQIDISDGEAGNFRDVPGQFKLHSWELPLIFRIGAAYHPWVTENHQLTLSMDALHPNNNTESLNLGAQYTFSSPSFGKFILRGGYKALFMEDSQYGLTFGAGLLTNFLFNKGVKFEYGFRDLGVLGSVHFYGISVLF